MKFLKNIPKNLHLYGIQNYMNKCLIFFVLVGVIASVLMGLVSSFGSPKEIIDTYTHMYTHKHT